MTSYILHPSEICALQQMVNCRFRCLDDFQYDGGLQITGCGDECSELIARRIISVISCLIYEDFPEHGCKRMQHTLRDELYNLTGSGHVMRGLRGLRIKLFSPCSHRALGKRTFRTSTPCASRHRSLEPVSQRDVGFPYSSDFILEDGKVVDAGTVVRLLEPFAYEDRVRRIESVISNRTFTILPIVEGKAKCVPCSVASVSAYFKTHYTLT